MFCQSASMLTMWKQNAETGHKKTMQNALEIERKKLNRKSSFHQKKNNNSRNK